MSFTTGFVSYSVPVTVQSRQRSSGSATFDYSGWCWLYDFNRMDFARDAAGNFIKTNGYVGWAQRLIKRIMTRKYTSPLYSDPDGTYGYGTTLEADIRGQSRPAMQKRLQDDIYTEVRKDPGTKDAINFQFTISGNRLDLSFEAIPHVGDPQTIHVPDLVRYA